MVYTELIYPDFSDVYARMRNERQTESQRLARERAARQLHEKTEAAIRKEVHRQTEKIIDKTIKELQIYFSTHPFKI